MGTAMHQLDRVVTGKGLERLRIAVENSRVMSDFPYRPSYSPTFDGSKRTPSLVNQRTTWPSRS